MSEVQIIKPCPGLFRPRYFENGPLIAARETDRWSCTRLHTTLTFGNGNSVEPLKFKRKPSSCWKIWATECVHHKKNADKAILQRTQFYLKLPLYCNWKHVFDVFEKTEWKRIHCNLQLYIFKFNPHFIEKLPKPVRVLSFLYRIKDTVKTHD